MDNKTATIFLLVMLTTVAIEIGVWYSFNLQAESGNSPAVSMTKEQGIPASNTQPITNKEVISPKSEILTTTASKTSPIISSTAKSESTPDKSDSSLAKQGSVSTSSQYYSLNAAALAKMLYFSGLIEQYCNQNGIYPKSLLDVSPGDQSDITAMIQSGLYKYQRSIDGRSYDLCLNFYVYGQRCVSNDKEKNADVNNARYVSSAFNKNDFVLALSMLTYEQEGLMKRTESCQNFKTQEQISNTEVFGKMIYMSTLIHQYCQNNQIYPKLLSDIIKGSPLDTAEIIKQNSFQYKLSSDNSNYDLCANFSPYGLKCMKADSAWISDIMEKSGATSMYDVVGTLTSEQSLLMRKILEGPDCPVESSSK